jgi:hypothetical protein
MNNFRKLNNLLGWLVWAVATYTYCSTIEPTASFWDCGEYIACSYKLEVGHPPGAPFFLLIARFFSLFSFGDPTKAAMMVNVMSALCSSFSILFLFWSITRLARKMISPNEIPTDGGKMWAILGSGIIGALAYTFSDSFWFSAVEGEVYAMSSLFTAAVFWAILKWEEEADAPSSMRWIVLIAFLTGMSIGVHLLNLLVIPSICFIYYYKKYKFSWKGFWITSIISVILLGGIQAGIIPGIAKLAADYELFFVNKMGLPFNSGTLVYFLLLFGVVALAIAYSINKKEGFFKLTFYAAIAFALFAAISGQDGGSIFVRLIVLGAMVYGIYYMKGKHAVLNTISLSFAMLIIGYSTFFVLVIRSQANTPMDENNPENALNMLSYLNREQYGNWPILYGNYYNAPTKPRSEFKDKTPIYAKDEKAKKYVLVDDMKHTDPTYEDDFCTIFPRMWSTQSNHESEYKYWGKVKGRPKQTMNRNGEPETVYVPTFMENLTYFFRYQVGYMYWRYFAWNFIGKQNDVQGLNNNPTDGNWITGISAFDEARLDAPDLYNPTTNTSNNKATNKFFALPFILGLLGLWFHYKNNAKDCFVVFCLFFFTGFAILIYLNQYPYQPRERDYAYAASFYAFSIWIGLGVLYLYTYFSKKMAAKNSAIAATVICLVVPFLMGSQGWDDHSRAKRYMARDFAVNYLNSCAPNAVLFTNGDNDTFPLWYAQEVEGIRTDVRVVNLSLFQTDWYIDQCRRAAYESAPLPFTMSPDKYAANRREIVYFMDKDIGYVNVKELMDYVASDNPDNKYNMGGEVLDILPTNKIRVPVDSAKVVQNGTVPKGMENRIVKNLEWQIRRGYIVKNDMMVLDLLAGFNWDRPIYFAVTTGRDAYIGLDEYLQLEGLAYRLTPIKSTREEMQAGSRINTEVMYNNIMTKFRWGGMSTPGVYLDENSLRFASNMRIQMGALASTLVAEGKKDKAIQILDKAMKEMPEETVPYDATIYSICIGYFQAGENKKAAPLAEKIFSMFEKDLKYYNRLPAYHKSSYANEIRRAKELMISLVGVTRSNGEMELSKKFESRLPAVISAEEMQSFGRPQPVQK